MGRLTLEGVRSTPRGHGGGEMGIAALKPLEVRVRRMLMSRQGQFTGRLVTGTAEMSQPILQVYQRRGGGGKESERRA